jgi:hypothetical protein
MKIFAVEIKEHFEKSGWRAIAFFSKFQEAQDYIERRKYSFPNAGHRIARYRRGRIYK